jgi:hypothetical protein
LDTTNPVASLAKRAVDLTYLLVLGVVVAGICMIFVDSLNPDKFYALITKNQNMFIDFVKLYAGAKIIAGGQGHMVYDSAVQAQWMNECAAPAHYNVLKYIQYPPYDFILATPLMVLPLVSSFATWTIATMLIGFAGMYYLRRVTGKSLTAIEASTLALLYAGSLFSFNSIILGQTAWLMLGIVCVFFGALIQKKEILCGLAIAVSTIKPQFLLLLAPPLLIKKMWKAIAVAAVLEIILLALGVGSVGWDNVVKYPQILAHAESDLFGRDNERMVSVRGVTSALFGGSAGFLISAGSVAIAVALLIWFWWKADNREAQLRAVSLSVLVFLIFSPHSFLYDCLILSIPTILLMRETSLSNALALQPLGKKAWCVFLLLVPVLSWVPYLHSEVLASQFLLLTNCCLLAALLIKRASNLPIVLPEDAQPDGSKSAVDK